MTKGPPTLLSRSVSLAGRAFGPAECGLFLIAALYAGAGYAAARHYGIADRFSFFMYSGAAGLATFFLALAAVCGRIVYIMVFKRPRRLTLYIIQDFKDFLCGGDRLLRAVPVFLIFMVFMSAFTSMKAMIPVIHPYVWDPLLTEIDRFVHGWTDPYRFLMPVLGSPAATTAINFIYNMWFFVMFGALYRQLFVIGNPRLRMRFFYSFFLSWIINGTIAAIVFSSAGPCFLRDITGRTDFMPLMHHLHEVAQSVPVWALRTQDMLLAAYQSETTGLGAGISAMPSMHISIAFIIALTGWHNSKTEGAALTAFLLCIMAGSVYLGWHYAIDGYFSLMTTWLIWRFSGLPARLPGAGRRRETGPAPPANDAG